MALPAIGALVARAAPLVARGVGSLLGRRGAQKAATAATTPAARALRDLGQRNPPPAAIQRAMRPMDPQAIAALRQLARPIGSRQSLTPDQVSRILKELARSPHRVGGPESRVSPSVRGAFRELARGPGRAAPRRAAPRPPARVDLLRARAAQAPSQAAPKRAADLTGEDFLRAILPRILGGGRRGAR